MSYIALARKWRPKSFDEVSGQYATLKILKNALESNRLHHAYIFTGTRGIGKTTIARLMAKALNCEQGVSSNPCCKCNTCIEIENGNHPDVIEVDAASKTKVEDTREILDNVAYSPTSSRFKIYIIDEVHMLSNHSFNALLKTLEEPPKHVKFLLATTDPQKIPITILSRCLQFHLTKFNTKELAEKIASILQAESIEYEEEALNRIAIAANGSLRDGLSLLEQVIAFSDGIITKQNTYEVIGVALEETLLELIYEITENNHKKVYEIIQQIADNGANFSNILNQLQTLFHNLCLLQFDINILEDTYFKHERIKQLANILTPEQIQLYYQIALKAQKDLPFCADDKIGFEMAIFRMLAFQPISYNHNNENKYNNYVNENSTNSKVNSHSEKIKAQPTNNSISSTQITQKGIINNHDGLKDDYKKSVNEKNHLSINVNENNLEIQSKYKNYPQGENKPQNNLNLQTKIQTKNESLDINPKNWHYIVKKLPISGLSKILAMNSVLDSFTNKTITIKVKETQAPLINQKNKIKLQQALSKFLNQEITLNVGIANINKSTPLEINQKQNEDAIDHAKNKMFNDPGYKDLIEKFNAEVIDISIR